MHSITRLSFRVLTAAALVALPIASIPAPTLARPVSRVAAHPPLPDSCTTHYPAINLGPMLSPFALLAGTTITNVGNTLVTDVPDRSHAVGFNADAVGVWPGTAVTGFYPPGTDTDGTNAIYAAAYNLHAGVPKAAQSELAIAYNTAAGRPATRLVSGDLSQAKVPGYPQGTLPPGIYKANTTLGVISGNLTLDGNRTTPSSVFIFQVGTTLTTTAGGLTSGNIILKNGASACNVYWQVGTSATLGGSTFNGNVLASTYISLNASTFNGRALAMNGAITLGVAGGSLITNSGGQ
jgi:hypothetical protein